MRIYTFYLFSFICLSGITHINGGSGTLDTMLLNSILKCPENRRQPMNVTEIYVYVYDFHINSSKAFPIDNAAKGILSYKKLDKRKKFYMFVSGFGTNINDTTADLVRETFKNVSNCYLILIDHSAYTNKSDGLKVSYERSVQHVYSIGVKLAEMLSKLHKGGINANHIHAIGHSLGGQMLGHVGHQFIKATGKKIARITALDPAGPCFSNSSKEEQVRAGVAKYVEVYHCNDGGLGTSSVLGDTDFYMNEGSFQPYCELPTRINTCSHSACVTMWMSSVAHRHWYPAKKCNKLNLSEIENWKCSSKEKTIPGFWNPGTAKGIYYVWTMKYKLVQKKFSKYIRYIYH